MECSRVTSSDSSWCSGQLLWDKIQRKNLRKIKLIEESDIDEELQVAIINDVKVNHHKKLLVLIGHSFQFHDTTLSAPHLTTRHNPAKGNMCWVNMQNSCVPNDFWNAGYVYPVEEEEIDKPSHFNSPLK